LQKLAGSVGKIPRVRLSFELFVGQKCDRVAAPTEHRPPKTLGIEIIADQQINLIVFDPNLEEIIQWIS
jgi:hypothetical protein